MKKKLVWIKLFAGLLVGSVLVAGGYFSAKFFKPGTVGTPTPTPIVSPTPSVVVTPVNTAGWKTHTNTKYGYSFKYPKDFEVDLGPLSPEQIQTYGSITIIKHLSSGEVEFGVRSSPSCNSDFAYNDEDLEKCKRAYFDNWGVGQKYPLYPVLRTIDNMNAQGFFFEYTNLLYNKHAKEELVFFTNRVGKIYSIYLSFLGVSLEEAALVNSEVEAILGTFRFTK